MIPKPILYLISAMLLVGAMPMPYGYYTMLRLAAFIVFSMLVYEFMIRGSKILSWIFALAAILFNPIIKVHLSKGIWTGLDIMAAVCLIGLAQLVPNANQNKDKL